MTLQINKPQLMRLERLNPGWDADSLAEELQCLLPNLIRDTPAKKLEANVDDNSDPPIVINDFSDGDAPIIIIRRGGIDFPITGNDLGGGTPEKSPPTVFPGVVVSYSGGNIYVVTIASGDVPVRQLEGDPAFPHAAGRSAIVIKNGDEYVMQIPVWG